MKNIRKCSLLVLMAGASLLYTSNPVFSQNLNTDHQYQFTVLQSGSFTRGLFVDQKTGDIWEYINQPTIKGQVDGGWYIKYVAKLQPTKAGECVAGTESYCKP
jgi:hypothetical protein